MGTPVSLPILRRAPTAEVLAFERADALEREGYLVRTSSDCPKKRHWIELHGRLLLVQAASNANAIPVAWRYPSRMWSTR